MKYVINEKRQMDMDLEYNLICDFMKLRSELGLSQRQKNVELLKNDSGNRK